MQETQETQVRFLGQEDSLEEEMVTHSSILAWKTPWTEETRQATVQRVTKSWHNWDTKHIHQKAYRKFIFLIGL